MVFPLLLGIAGYYAVFGGEYSWWELRQARARHAAESEELARLRVELDSLRAWVHTRETDPAMLERLARERYGLVMDDEILYRFVEPEDTTREGDDTR